MGSTLNGYRLDITPSDGIDCCTAHRVVRSSWQSRKCCCFTSCAVFVTALHVQNVCMSAPPVEDDEGKEEEDMVEGETAEEDAEEA